MESQKFIHKYLGIHEGRMNNRRISRKFYHEIFILEQNSRNHESFLPQKFGAIWYVNFSGNKLLRYQIQGTNFKCSNTIAMVTLTMVTVLPRQQCCHVQSKVLLCLHHLDVYGRCSSCV